jgi:hypothetical protein
MVSRRRCAFLNLGNTWCSKEVCDFSGTEDSLIYGQGCAEILSGADFNGVKKV